MENYTNKIIDQSPKTDDKKTAKLSVSHQNIEINSANTRL